MTRRPKLSIVTPSYNQAQFLEETICSVIDQGYPDLEYIIIDGGSTDGSVEIIKKYESHLTYWVSEKDSGQSEAINKGFKRCTGDVIAWLNSDDLYAPGSFKHALNFLDKRPDVDMVYGDAEIVDAEGSFIMHRKELSFDRTMGRLIGFGFLIPQPAAFWRKSVLDNVGLLNESLDYSMDSDLWRRISDQHKVEHISELLAVARYHKDAKTIQVLGGNAEAAMLTEWNAEKALSYAKLPISRVIPSRFSNLVGRIYRLKRIFGRAARGHYFKGYVPAWRFR